jgi:hypothetical protein
MLRTPLLAVLLLAAAPAWAQQYPAAPLSPNGEQARAFSLKNMSHQPVVSARAFMTDGQTRVLTHSPIEPGQAREVVVPRKDCLKAVSVQLNNGRSLKADHLNDCRSNLLIVGDNGIDVMGADVQRLRMGGQPPPAGGAHPAASPRAQPQR